ARLRHGGHPRHRPLQHLHRLGDRRVRQRRHRDGARRPRRPDGAGGLRDDGGEIVNLLDTSAWYAPGAAAAQMVDSVCLDQKRVLPCTAYLEGEYGIDGLYMGVPVKIGAAGIEEIVELELSDDEQSALEASGAAVRDVVGVLTT